ncbi:hypothetical protein L1987_48791 [Smallanthus sonchifolius]|uniref:Uncharacterized protein n=1 Tax=Smallanthus sonchifolius TaxID=185202 RepID=A0ACB9FSX3_9ASTR|nr:hypothetical protein L1987_48791 [Smallanthus sonchifolius]
MFYSASLEATTSSSSSSIADKIHAVNDIFVFVFFLICPLDSQHINYAKELQSILRRKRGDKHLLTSSVKEYLEKKLKAKKIIFRSLSDFQKQCSSSVNEDTRVTSNIDILKEMKLKTLIVLEALLLTFILGSKSQLKPKGWSLVFKMMGNKHVESDQSREESKVKKMDDELQALICFKKKQTGILEVNSIQMKLADLELNLLDLGRTIRLSMQTFDQN